MGRIREERRKAGLTQWQVAEKIGITQQAYQKLEKRDRGTITKLQVIAQIFAIEQKDDPAAVLGRFGHFDNKEPPVSAGG